MIATYIYISCAVVVQGLIGLAGGVLSEGWLKRHHSGLICFAAGAMIGAAFLDVLPESTAAMGRSAYVWGFAGFGALAILEWRYGGHHHEECANRPSRSLGYTLLFSDALHNIGDGAAVAAAFLVSTGAGMGVALAIAAHELPQELGDYAIMRRSGFGRWDALLALAAVQLTAAIGAAGIVFGAQHIGQLTPITLAIAAGGFLYIGATDLLPELHARAIDANRRERMLGFLAGAGLLILAALVEWGQVGLQWTRVSG